MLQPFTYCCDDSLRSTERKEFNGECGDIVRKTCFLIPPTRIEINFSPSLFFWKTPQQVSDFFSCRCQIFPPSSVAAAAPRVVVADRGGVKNGRTDLPPKARVGAIPSAGCHQQKPTYLHNYVEKRERNGRRGGALSLLLFVLPPRYLFALCTPPSLPPFVPFPRVC